MRGPIICSEHGFVDGFLGATCCAPPRLNHVHWEEEEEDEDTSANGHSGELARLSENSPSWEDQRATNLEGHDGSYLTIGDSSALLSSLTVYLGLQ